MSSMERSMVYDRVGNWIEVVASLFSHYTLLLHTVQWITFACLWLCSFVVNLSFFKIQSSG